MVETYLKQRVDKRTLIFVMRLRFKIKTNLVSTLSSASKGLPFSQKRLIFAVALYTLQFRYFNESDFKKKAFKP